jgi:gliding motility-associated-like protein
MLKTMLIRQLLPSLAILAATGLVHPVSAAHIIGGEIVYECLGWLNGDPATNTRVYQFTMYIYRDCQGGGARFDSAPGAPYTATVTIYEAGSAMPVLNLSLGAPIVSLIDPDAGNPCLRVPPNVCVEQGVYVFPLVELPVSDRSYHIVYQRCCRNNTIDNIIDPGGSGATYTIELTPSAQELCNNSPVFDDFPPVVICVGEPLNFSHAAADADGDQLVYEFCAPFLGGGLNFGQPFALDGLAPNPDAPPPYAPVVFQAPNYSPLAPLGTAANISIDPNTGLITGVPQTQGQFVVGVCVKEFRNGVLLSIMQRDFQFNVTTCSPTVVADIQEDSIGNAGEFLISRCGAQRITVLNQSFQQSFINEFFWVFDLGNRDTIINTWHATVEFPGPGEYRGNLYLNPGTECGDTADILVRIFPEIQADFSYAYDTCRAGPVAFTDLTAAGAPLRSWSWSFGDGNTAANRNPSHRYADPGIPTVSLLVTDDNGCTDEASREIVYFPVPALIIIAPNTYVGCAPATIFFDNLSNPINEDYELFWDFGDGGTSTAISPEHVYAQEGVYAVGLEIISPIGCRTDTVFQDLIAIEPSPLARFAYSPDDLDNFRPEVQFSDLSSGASRWEWSVEGQRFSVAQHPAYTFRDTGLQAVQLIVTHPNGCRDTARQHLDVVPKVTYFLPNAFSPNDDAVNDLFIGKGFLRGLRSFEMSIWNRWGEEVFRTDDPAVGWNGKKQNGGQPLPEGVYVCLVRYVGPRGEQVELRGQAALLR